jgi:hypothetical protein
VRRLKSRPINVKNVEKISAYLVENLIKKICKTCSEKNNSSRAGSPLNLISGIITGFRIKKNN